MEVGKIFVALSALFLLSCYFGYLLADLYPEFARREIEILKEFLKSITSEEISPVAIFIIIILNNSIKSFVAMVLGVLLGIVPILFVITNGLIIGVFANVFGEEIGTFSFILKIIPHGILEIPAIILASSYGVWLGIEFLRDRKNIDKHMRYATGQFVKIVLPMLIVAAVIEAMLMTLT
ncbi:MAG: stage II sporulation protein M [Archaeoglobaceae archaeon]|nr:stage II sporulation protein M [Archaeoglobaceae archaeon]MDW8118056.1 stage II sporulation protein M [Archaeoglobaceae archaeon]